MLTIRRQLQLGLLAATLLCVLGAGISLFRSLLEETNELADLQLRQLAVALPDEFEPQTGLPAAQDPEEAFVLQAWDEDGQPLPVLPDQPQLPRYALAGFADVLVQGEDWRLYGVTRRGRYVQVAQAQAVRDQLAWQMTVRAGAPLLAFALLLGLLIVVVVGRALAPLQRLAASVAGRSPDALTPLAADDMPPELRPVVLALNSLMGQFEAALTAQRTFVADAAHELRSPLTALKLQLQVAERAASEEERRVALARLHERLDRSTHLVRQLLSLARHETALAASQLHTVDLGQLLEAAVADHSALADSREIDLGVVETLPATVLVQADPDGLQVLLKGGAGRGPASAARFRQRPRRAAPAPCAPVRPLLPPRRQRRLGLRPGPVHRAPHRRAPPGRHRAGRRGGGAGLAGDGALSAGGLNGQKKADAGEGIRFSVAGEALTPAR
ncbi:MAG: sensor histidine kinase N-terminal domain-containing protein [Janthinobacterium sp.]|nr:histidine kinase dimerization/phospho-acceptor domain-containing protein [Janthinobacterium sp.]MCX7290007.1 sensor histidine kinase N-terminal domain-containing protein [Janthinobacterium sp.]